MRSERKGKDDKWEKKKGGEVREKERMKSEKKEKDEKWDKKKGWAVREKERMKSERKWKRKWKESIQVLYYYTITEQLPV